MVGAVKLEGVYQEVLDGYLIELKRLMETVDRYDKRIEELSQLGTYREPVNKLTCFLGVKRLSALSIHGRDWGFHAVSLS